jgi:4'-phosphopantetheinyl transferase
MPDRLNIARRYFAPPEARSLEVMSPVDRERRFVELWTLKESYIKAIGSGLAAPLERFAVDLSGTPRPRFWAEDDPCA